MTSPKKILYYCLAAVLALLVIEGMARLAYFLAYDQWYGSTAPGITAATPLPGGAAPDAAQAGQNIQHPFYGFTSPLPAHDLNAAQPRQRQDDTVLIGILGGTVAQNIIPSFQRAVHRYFSDNNLPGRPVVLELTKEGMKQPQQVTITAYNLLLGGDFDIVVNLDGYNEVYLSDENAAAGVFPFFPYQWHKLVGLTTEETLLTGRVALRREEQADLLRSAAASPFRFTAVYGLLNRYRYQRNENRIAELNRQLVETESAYSLEKHGPRWAFRDAADLHQETARVWYRSSLILARWTRLAGADYYHFLQPSQYVPDAKPLTPPERETAYAAGSVQESYRDAYPLLAEFGAELQRQQVNFADLTHIFADRSETLYIDTCCRLNDRGGELLAEAIVQRIAPSLRQAAVADPPASPFDDADIPTPAPQPDELLIAADFQVYRTADNSLVYVKDACTSQDAQSRFFLHITPVDQDNLSAARQEHGFDRWDFQFERAGGILNGQCLVERPLPRYPIAALRTGQYAPGGDIIWEGQSQFPQ